MKTASLATAAIAGLWSGVGFSLSDNWVENAFPGALYVQVIVFFIVPVLVFVIGKQAPLSLLWFATPSGRAQQAETFKRMLMWFLGAASVGAIISLASLLLRSGS